MAKEGITIEDYTEKSFVVRGETQQYKEDLKALGGKWNSRLTDRISGEYFGAWIYPMSKQDTIQAWADGDVAAPPRPTLAQARTSFENTAGTFRSSSGSTDRQVLMELKKLNARFDKLEKLLVAFMSGEDVEIEQEESSEDEVAPPARLMGKAAVKPRRR